MENPWTTKSEKNGYSCERYDLKLYDVLDPAGKPREYPVMRFKQKSTAVCAVDNDGYVYLVGQWRYGAGYYSWEVPKGRTEGNEHPKETIKRELKEEAGIIASSWEYLGMVYPNNTLTDEEGHLFLARDLIIGENSPEEDEKITVKKIKLVDFVNEILHGKITDALTVCCVMMAYTKIKDEIK